MQTQRAFQASAKPPAARGLVRARSAAPAKPVGKRLLRARFPGAGAQWAGGTADSCRNRPPTPSLAAAAQHIGIENYVEKVPESLLRPGIDDPKGWVAWRGRPSGRPPHGRPLAPPRDLI